MSAKPVTEDTAGGVDTISGATSAASAATEPERESERRTGQRTGGAHRRARGTDLDDDTNATHALPRPEELLGVGAVVAAEEEPPVATAGPAKADADAADDKAASERADSDVRGTEPADSNDELGSEESQVQLPESAPSEAEDGNAAEGDQSETRPLAFANHGAPGAGKTRWVGSDWSEPEPEPAEEPTAELDRTPRAKPIQPEDGESTPYDSGETRDHQTQELTTTDLLTKDSKSKSSKKKQSKQELTKDWTARDESESILAGPHPPADDEDAPDRSKSHPTPALDEPTRRRRRRRSIPRSAYGRRPVIGLTLVVLLTMAGAFFGWTSADPLWLTAGRGDTGTATVSNCLRTGIATTCYGKFVSGKRSVGDVTISGLNAENRRTGGEQPARMLGDNHSWAYVGPTWTLALQWGLGLAAALVMSILAVVASGAGYLRPQGRGKVFLGRLAAFASPLLAYGLLLLTGLL